MAKFQVINASTAYTDEDGHERWAEHGEVIELDKAQSDRLLALHTPAVAPVRAAKKAEKDADAAAQAAEEARLAAEQAKQEADELAAADAAAGKGSAPPAS